MQSLFVKTILQLKSAVAALLILLTVVAALPAQAGTWTIEHVVESNGFHDYWSYWERGSSSTTGGVAPLKVTRGQNATSPAIAGGDYYKPSWEPGPA